MTASSWDAWCNMSLTARASSPSAGHTRGSLAALGAQQAARTPTTVGLRGLTVILRCRSPVIGDLVE